MSISCTQAERDLLAAAIKSGVVRVNYQDRTVQYGSLPEMRAILAEMDEYLAGSAAPERHSRVAHTRG